LTKNNKIIIVLAFCLPTSPMETVHCNRTRILAALTTGTFLVITLHSLVMGVPAQTAGAVFTECADGIDNDSDGLIDYPQDVQCLSLHDDSEGPTGRGLFLSLSDGLDTVLPNGNVTYTITLKTERDGGKEVDVYFQMPHQTNLISASAGGYQQDEMIVWKNVSVFKGSTTKLYINVAVSPYAKEDLLLVAQATSEGEKDSDTTRVTGASDVPYNAADQINVSVTDGKKYAQRGELLNYTISVRNPSRDEKTFTLRLEIPTETMVEYVGGDHSKTRQAITWADQKIGPDRARDYKVSVRITDDAKEFYNIRTRASVAAASATDTTTVHTGVLPDALVVSTTDGLTQASPGSLVTYNVIVENTTEKLATEIDVNNMLPTFMEFVDASEGGYWTGKNVRWNGLTVSPYGTRNLRVTGRVRSDAPKGERLRNTVSVKGYESVDYTEIASIASGKGVQRDIQNVLVNKRANKSEVRPGESVTYTVTLLNVTDHALRNVMVDDRMDSPYVRIVSADNGKTDGSSIHWNINELAPGQQWAVRYTVQIDPRAPHGVEVPNIVTVSGDGMEQLALTERIYTSNIEVVSNLPPTGAPFDAIFLGVTGLAGAAQTLAQRRKLFRRA